MNASFHAKEELAISEISAIESLSIRQLEVLQLGCKGLSSKEIGIQLNITKTTADYHWKRIFKKLEVTSREEAAVIAAHVGIV
jgi:DNA-binding CsgD family transcriptional regulator